MRVDRISYNVVGEEGESSSGTYTYERVTYANPAREDDWRVVEMAGRPFQGNMLCSAAEVLWTMARNLRESI